MLVRDHKSSLEDSASLATMSERGHAHGWEGVLLTCRSCLWQEPVPSAAHQLAGKFLNARLPLWPDLPTQKLEHTFQQTVMHIDSCSGQV